MDEKELEQFDTQENETAEEVTSEETLANDEEKIETVAETEESGEQPEEHTEEVEAEEQPEEQTEETESEESAEEQTEETESEKSAEEQAEEVESEESAEEQTEEVESEESAEEQAEEVESEESAEEQPEETLETSEQTLEEPEAPKEKKPNKFGLFVKAHKLWFILAAVAVVLAIAAVAAYFIVTKDLVFIRNAEDFVTAASEGKGDTLVLKDDVTVDGDVTFEKAYEVDLNGYTLTVNGTLTFNAADNDETVLVFKTDAKKLEENAGSVVASAFVVNGKATDLNFVSALSAGNVKLAVKNATFGALNADKVVVTSATSVNFAKGIAAKAVASVVLDVENCSEQVTVGAAIAGNVNMKSSVVIVFSCGASAKDVSGGKLVTVSDKASLSSVSDSAKLVVAPTGTVDTINRVGTVVFQEKLATPSGITFVEASGSFFATVQAVYNAQRYHYQVIDQGGNVVAEANDIINPVNIRIKNITPGTYTFKVCALNADNSEQYVASDWAEKEFTYSVKLQAPSAVSEGIASDSGKLSDKFTITPVDNADYYVISVNGTVFADHYTDLSTPVDISSVTTALGDYFVNIQACSDNTAYNNSDVALYTYTKTASLAEVVFDDALWTEADGKMSVSWTAVENAKYYEVTLVTVPADPTMQGSVIATYFTTGTTLDVVIPTETQTVEGVEVEVELVYGTDYVVCIKAIGYGYFTEYAA